ncbi:hypothetical protein SAPIO_CDS2338 [Scedosporium apiospermum]|uniref:Methyltransferase domain-containing protein n=1 Tax=Pseudallescheria apiosperma TaxID=563466 RepID=A0A084GC99_PSEDA|nr:uncharacterized protein SAPIO_CDS2338 [Scedosporium apiospermum]KEZ44961.1 hypothetical protein SAPIO_CDS2338 [Scedosporium apiospermum]
MSSPKSPKSPAKSPKSPPKSRSPSAGAASPAGDLLGAGDAPIEVDAADGDSVYAQSTVTDTTSLRSSILDFKWENGRRYHAYQEGSYWGPNDERQQEAEDILHEMYRLVLDNKLQLAPLGDDVQRVLDVGCGTGAWAIDFADENPAAEVVGVDLSPIQPNFLPPNCKFEVDDLIQDWTYPEDHFDFIHVRFMTGCIPDWVEFYKKAMRRMKPGGWIEHVELSSIARSDDGSLKPDTALVKWADIFQKIGAATGKSFSISETAPDLIREAGFTNIQHRTLKIPIGTWPKDRTLKHWGAWNRQFLLQAIEGLSIRGLTEILGWTFEEAQLYLVQIRADITDPKIHSYIEMIVVDGQRPEEAGE